MICFHPLRQRDSINFYFITCKINDNTFPNKFIKERTKTVISGICLTSFDAFTLVRNSIFVQTFARPKSGYSEGKQI